MKDYEDRHSAMDGLEVLTAAGLALLFVALLLVGLNLCGLR